MSTVSGSCSFIHLFFLTMRQCVSTMSSRCSRSAVPAPNPTHLHFHITMSSPLARGAEEGSLLIHPESLFFHNTDFFIYTFLCAAFNCSFISNLHPDTKATRTFASAPKFYSSSSSSSKHWEKHKCASFQSLTTTTKDASLISANCFLVYTGHAPNAP